jgi:hypothetical protein
MRAVAAYRRSHGVISVAAKTSDISRDTFYRWMEENAVFRYMVERAKDENIDFVENKLWERIERGDPWAIQMYLRANHPAYGEKMQLNVKQMSPSWMEKLDGKKPKVFKPRANQAAALERAIDGQNTSKVARIIEHSMEDGS